MGRPQVRPPRYTTEREEKRKEEILEMFESLGELAKRRAELENEREMNVPNRDYDDIDRLAYERRQLEIGFSFRRRSRHDTHKL